MAPKKPQSAPTKPLSGEDKRLAIAEVNARHQAGELTAEAAQAEIDALSGVARVVDEVSGDTFTVDAQAVESGEIQLTDTQTVQD